MDSNKTASTISMATLLVKSRSASLERETSENASTQSTEEEYTVILPSNKRPPRKALPLDEDEPLIDTTAPIPLNSKKTKRREEQQLKKRQQQAHQSKPPSLLALPAELLLEILRHLPPSDIFTLQRLNHVTQTFLLAHEPSLARAIIRTRYWVLTRSFPLPVAAHALDAASAAALQRSKRPELLATLHRPHHQHIPAPDAAQICTCTSCLLAWNNLCLARDFAACQTALDAGQPLVLAAPQERAAPSPASAARLAATGRVVQRALRSPLAYAALLQAHLRSITGTLQRHARAATAPTTRWQRNAARTLTGPARRGPTPSGGGAGLPYAMSARDVAAGTDAFLERAGAPSYEAPVSRDDYYSLQAYVPNRRWVVDAGDGGEGGEQEGRWQYFGTQHEKDLAWVRARFRGEGEKGLPREELLRVFRAAFFEAESGVGGGL